MGDVSKTVAAELKRLRSGKAPSSQDPLRLPASDRQNRRAVSRSEPLGTVQSASVCHDSLSHGGDRQLFAPKGSVPAWDIMGFLRGCSFYLQDCHAQRSSIRGNSIASQPKIG